jgi:hypothetical protein
MFIYLVETVESIIKKENVFKLGKTIQSRINQRTIYYPKKSKLLFCINVNDPNKAEVELLKIFNNKFIKREDYGNEYFKGDINKMIKSITTYNNRVNKYTTLKDNTLHLCTFKTPIF